MNSQAVMRDVNTRVLPIGKRGTNDSRKVAGITHSCHIRCMEDCQVEKLMTYAKSLPEQAGGQIGLRLGYPEYAGAQEFAARLAQLRALGAEGVNIYNYGLVPKGRLSWLNGQLS